MNKYACLFLLVYSLLTDANQLKIMALKDPFNIPMFSSCSELETQLINQLNQWQFRGYMIDKQQEYTLTAIIQSKKTNTWLSVPDLNILSPLLPWQINDISSSFIRWHVDLPDYCNKKLFITMKLEGI